MDNKYKSVPVKSSEITSYSQYISRREFLRTAGILTGSALLAAIERGAYEAGVREMTSLCTTTAASFYAMHGYEVGERTEHPLSCGEVLPCAPIRKSLS